MLDRPNDAAEYVFPVDGMTCASCSLRVEKALAAVPGVKSAAVNLSAMTARVEADRSVRPADLVAAVEDAGYEAPREEILLDVTGMTCAACVARLEKALNATPGVMSARVSLPAETADVTIASGLASVADLVEAIVDFLQPRRERVAACVEIDAEGFEFVPDGNEFGIAAALGAHLQFERIDIRRKLAHQHCLLLDQFRCRGSVGGS